MAPLAMRPARFDYIIVGGGTSGCVLANRLSADPNKQVLVLEPGPSPRGSLKIAAPVALTKLFFSPWDWGFESRATTGTANRPVHLGRGKALGGSSAFNALLYHRGSAADFDDWGLKEWSSAAMGPAFERSLINVEDARYTNPLSLKFLDAAAQAGHRHSTDFNDWSATQEGVGRFQLQTRRGRRHHAASAYLRPAMRRPNLHVECGARVTRLLLDSDKRAVGVAFTSDDASGEVRERVSDGEGEVILCAGAVQSPQLLMLSGIGGEAELQAHQIPQLVDLPGVGRNLQDHPAIVSGYRINAPLSITDEMFLTKGILSPARVAEWLARGSGPLATSGCDFGGFFRTRQGMDQPDLQLRFVPGLGTSPDGVGSYRDIGKSGRTPSGITLQSLAIRPQARGAVTLRSSDPSEPPLIDPGYGSSAEDMATLRAGLRISKSIAEQPAFGDLLEAEAWPCLDLNDEAALDDYISNTVHSGNALAGTCKMGTATGRDGSAVVDERLNVIGTRGLRVVDASVIPTMPGGQLAATVVAMAERAAEMIVAEKAEEAPSMAGQKA